MKQILFDILIVLILPALIVIGYFAFRNGNVQEAWISITGDTTTTQDLGARTTQALNELERIKLDSSIFTWKEFKDMKFNEVKNKEDPVGKKNPFGAD